MKRFWIEKKEVSEETGRHEWSNWDGPYRSLSSAYVDFDLKYREPGGPRKQTFRIIEEATTVPPFRVKRMDRVESNEEGEA